MKSKRFQHVAHSQVSAYFDKYNLLAPYMYGHDTAIDYLLDDVDELHLILQHDLQIISYYMHENQLN